MGNGKARKKTPSQGKGKELTAGASLRSQVVGDRTLFNLQRTRALQAWTRV